MTLVVELVNKKPYHNMHSSRHKIFEFDAFTLKGVLIFTSPGDLAQLGSVGSNTFSS
jgi:hypothetical protein